MNAFDENIDELLAKYLAGECTPEEETTVREWLAASPENQAQLADLVWLWERAPNGLPNMPRAVDTDAALRKVKNRIQGGDRQVFLAWPAGFWLRAAAVFVLALAALYWWPRSAGVEPIRIAATESSLTDTLADGSIFRLEQHSGITLNANFNRRERRLHLDGQAFFKVAPDTSRPFVVEVRDLLVQVVGTAFTVDNKSTPGQVVVTVEEGKVRVQWKTLDLLLQAGEQATYDQAKGSLRRTSPEQGSPLYKNRIFNFDATPLNAVVEQLGKAYGVHIFLKNKKLENCPLTARYNQLPLERVLQLVTESFSLKIEKTENGGYALLGDGCEE